MVDVTEVAEIMREYRASWARDPLWWEGVRASDVKVVQCAVDVATRLGVLDGINGDAVSMPRLARFWPSFWTVIRSTDRGPVIAMIMLADVTIAAKGDLGTIEDMITDPAGWGFAHLEDDGSLTMADVEDVPSDVAWWGRMVVARGLDDVATFRVLCDVLGEDVDLWADHLIRALTGAALEAYRHVSAAVEAEQGEDR